VSARLTDASLPQHVYERSEQFAYLFFVNRKANKKVNEKLLKALTKEFL
jgi:hypothetical protein